jgi:beta-phosphoglucomutase-like phosphatase (HAD superfamily)
MEHVRVVIFDCDGVMFDSKQANEAYYNHILAHFGKPQMNGRQSDFVHMNTAERSVAYLFRGDPKLQDAMGYWRGMSYLPFIPLMEMEPYLKEFLAYLRPAHKTAISTNRSDTMGPVLAHHGLEAYFDLVVSCLDVKDPKPSPESLLKIIDHFKLSPEEAIYVGDSEIDESAARAAGIRLVAYKNPVLSAACHVTHFREVENLLRKNRTIGKG